MMEQKQEIVKVVNSRISRKLTQEELEQYEKEYFGEVERLSLAVFGYFNDPKTEAYKSRELILDKILSPFEYWLRNKLECEAINTRNGETR